MDRPSDKAIVVRNIAIGVVIVGAIVAAILFWGRDRFFGPGEPRTAGRQVESNGPSVAAPPEVAPGADHEATALTGDATLPGPEQRWFDLVGTPPDWPSDLSVPPSCEDADRELEAVCAALDARVEDLARLGGACALIESASRALAERPPPAGPELRRHESVLANVFHLFRVLGRERVLALRRLLAEEELAEPAALALHRWLLAHETCPRGAAAIRLEPLYDYAAFAFTTLGGQAYMRRRSPRVEALACFYALQTLDRAIETNHNPRGVDPRPEIRRCRSLLQGQNLVFTDRYVAALDEMEARWPQG